jgi:hypothetical protein
MQRKIWEMSVCSVNDELKQSLLNDFSRLINAAKEMPILIQHESLKYKIMHPHEDASFIDKKEVLDEICYAYRIDYNMKKVSAAIGEFNFRENSFR